MHLQQNGTRVFFWDINGAIKYGTVQSTSRMTDVSLNNESLCDELLTTFGTGNPSGKRQS
jgi:hypothetical protein